MEMINRKKGYTDAIGKHTHEKLAKFRVDVFQLLVNMYELIAENNNQLFEWENNGVVEGKVNWMEIFLSSFNSKFDFKKKVGCYAKDYIYHK